MSFNHAVESVMLPVPDIHDLPTIRLSRLNYAFVFAREHTAGTSSAQDDTLAIPNILACRGVNDGKS
jgi:hypothetical protein